MRPLAIACRLNPFEFAVRRKTLLPAVVARAEHSEPLPDGMRWRFRPSSDLLLALAAMIDAERRCCPFLRFNSSPSLTIGQCHWKSPAPKAPASFSMRCRIAERKAGLRPNKRRQLAGASTLRNVGLCAG
jgi:hypothetical protein